jgi:hypothetical protein
MNPINQCNNCQNRNCKPQTYKSVSAQETPCPQLQPMRTWRTRLINLAIYHEVIEYGQVLHAGRLSHPRIGGIM